MKKYCAVFILFFSFFLLASRQAFASNAGIIKQVNQLREVHGLPGLKENYLLSLSASERACDLHNNQYFSHTDTQGNFFTWWINRKGYNFIFAGENLAKDFANDFQVVQAWKNSSSHYQILVSPRYEEIGIGHCGSYVVAHFGKQRTAYLGLRKSVSEFVVLYIRKLPQLAWLNKDKWFASIYI